MGFCGVFTGYIWNFLWVFYSHGIPYGACYGVALWDFLRCLFMGVSCGVSLWEVFSLPLERRVAILTAVSNIPHFYTQSSLK